MPDTPVAQNDPRDVVILYATGWDDWFKYSTLYNLVYVDAEGVHHHIGGTKIGEYGLRPARKGDEPREGYRSPTLPKRFRALDKDRFFSLGQDTSFYEGLSDIGDEFRDKVLDAINDIAYDVDLRERAEEEPVTGVSLLREVPLATVKEQFARIARGGALLTEYKFGYRINGPDSRADATLMFAVRPNSRPPSNVQVLIGRNGVGKSTLLNGLAHAMVNGSRSVDDDGSPSRGPWEQLSNVVSVSFSAFDAFEPLSVPQDRSKGGLTYHYVGLKKIGGRAEDRGSKDSAALSRDFTRAARACLVGARRPRLNRALRLLEGDPIFAEAGLADIVGADDDSEEVIERLPQIYRRLSSGHKIVLLTIAKLVETVEERSLVLLDEPEAHLHPPLLSALIRTLSDLLTNRNGVAIVATHSPVVLQEVPRSCVWKLHRSGDFLRVERPQMETFGENVGILTDEVFGLEVTNTGFHKMLQDAAVGARTFDGVMALFDNEVGSEGRAILRAMISALSERYVEH